MLPVSPLNVSHLYHLIAQPLEMSPLGDLLAQKVVCIFAETVRTVQTESNPTGRFETSSLSALKQLIQMLNGLCVTYEGYIYCFAMST